jgi:hypothetical protein
MSLCPGGIMRTAEQTANMRCNIAHRVETAKLRLTTVAFPSGKVLAGWPHGIAQEPAPRSRRPTCSPNATPH